MPIQYKTIKVIDSVATGRYYKELRRKHKMTQADMARKIGVCCKTIQALETGNRTWTKGNAASYEWALEEK